MTKGELKKFKNERQSQISQAQYELKAIEVIAYHTRDFFFENGEKKRTQINKKFGQSLRNELIKIYGKQVEIIDRHWDTKLKGTPAIYCSCEKHSSFYCWIITVSWRTKAGDVARLSFTFQKNDVQDLLNDIEWIKNHKEDILVRYKKELFSVDNVYKVCTEFVTRVATERQKLISELGFDDSDLRSQFPFFRKYHPEF